MLAISLMRMGATKSPFYRVVVKEKRSKRDGAYLENLGTYDPKQDPAEVNLKHERIQYWISVGALQISPRALRPTLPDCS